MIGAITRMNSENMLSETNQSQNHILYDSTYMKYSEYRFIETKKISGYSRKWKLTANIYRVLYGVMKRSQNWTVVMVAHSVNIKNHGIFYAFKWCVWYVVELHDKACA
jgi:hypothetical protein